MFLLQLLLVLVFKEHFENFVLVLVHLVEEKERSLERIRVSVALLAQQLRPEVVDHFSSVFLVVHDFHFSVDLHLIFSVVNVEDSVPKFLIPRQNAAAKLVGEKEEGLNVVVEARLLALERAQRAEHQIADRVGVNLASFLNFEARNDAEINQSELKL